MGFLDNNGLTRVWGKIKAGFASSLGISGNTLTLKSGSGESLSSVTLPAGSGGANPDIYTDDGIVRGATSAGQEVVIARVNKASGDSTGPKLTFVWQASVEGDTVSRSAYFQGNKLVLPSPLNLDVSQTVTSRTLKGNSNNNLYVDSNLLPNSNSNYDLGSTSARWKTVYASTGTIQTSDRSAKDSIHYLSENVPAGAAKMKARSISAEAENYITVSDVIDFVRTLDPATFCYKTDENETATEENSSPEAVQLGIIADDIKDHPLFKYIGAEMDAERVITPEVRDEATGEVITEAVTESYKTLGVQPVPLAVAALTACGYLLRENDSLKEQLSAIEKRLAAAGI